MCELHFKNDYELLVAVILSAQCTDKRVNEVTPILFEKYPNYHFLANAGVEDVEKIILPCGFYHNKAKNIIQASKQIEEHFNSKLPDKLEDLTTLAGVGRKTANVLISNIYHIPAIAVDTHVFRVSNRIGLAKTDNVLDCEKQLMTAIKKEHWSEMHHILVLFGRYYCKARNPLCANCVLKDVCKGYKVWNGKNS